jgi:aminoglycoside 6'-N-acetyltransferase I
MSKRRRAPKIRLAGAADLKGVLRLATALWPDDPAREQRPHLRAVLAGKPQSTLPLVLFVADDGGALCGFVEVGLRSHADGCDGRRAVGFVEGWFVVAERRGQGIGRALIKAAEAWARDQGCREMASDTWADNEASARAHEALGFAVVDRCINFRKPLK